MSENKNNVERINLSDAEQLWKLTERWGCKPSDLQLGVKMVGDVVADLERWLRRNGKCSGAT